MSKTLSLLFAAIVLIALSLVVPAQRKARLGRVCGDPTARCKGRENFQQSDLPFDTLSNLALKEKLDEIGRTQ